MINEKVGGLKCLRLMELATQFWLTKASLMKMFLFGLKKYKFGWLRT